MGIYRGSVPFQGGALGLILVVIASLISCRFGNIEIVDESGPSGPIYISEIQVRNSSTLFDDQGDYGDWFELGNRSDARVSLSGYSVSDSRKKPGKWSFPALDLDPGAFVVVFASGKDHADPAYFLHTNFKLSSDGEGLFLFQGGGLVDSVALVESGKDESLIRDGDWKLTRAGKPSPGAVNVERQSDVSFSQVAGIYSASAYPGGLSVSLSAQSGEIRYTTDGSEPGPDSNLYRESLKLLPPEGDDLPTALTVRARCYQDGVGGPIASNSYILGQGTTLGVFSISCANDDLFSSASGIWHDDNLYEAWERRAHIEYFDQSGAKVLDTDAGISAFGAYSRTAPIKSLAMHARAVYGSGRFHYDFFHKRNYLGGAIEDFDDLVLRNSGNDWDVSMLRDAFMTGLLEGDDLNDGLHVEHQAYRPVAVYINGQYWGFYSLREKVNEPFLYDNRPECKGKALDIVTNYWDVNTGSNQELNDLMEAIDDLDLSRQADYDYLAARVDVDNFMDYWIFNVYIDNTDWPGNNLKSWKTEDGGSKWRWIAFDTDFGYGLTDIWNGWTNSESADFPTRIGSNDTLAFSLRADGVDWPNPESSTRIIRKLLENPGFKKRFFTRMEQLISGRFSAERCLALLDKMADEVREEISSRHLRRWVGTIYNWTEDQGQRAGTWEWNVEIMRHFARNRPDYMRGFMEGWDKEVDPQRGSGTGLSATYYQGTELAGTAYTRTDQVIDFNWGETGPSLGPIVNTNFSARWTGSLESSFTGPTTLTLSPDDGLRFWIGDLSGDPDIDAWIGQGVTPYSLSLDLVAGRKYPIKIEYFQGEGAAELHFRWRFGMFSELVPQSQLYPSP